MPPSGVGTPLAVGLTVAVKVTGWPNTEEVGDADTAVVLAAGLTFWLTGVVGLLWPKLPSPLYRALTVCVPPGMVLMVKVAWPLPFSGEAGDWATPSMRNVTDPVGLVLPETCATVAVKVTDWPKFDGFSDETMVVVLAARTICVRLPDVLAPKLLLPA